MTRRGLIPILAVGFLMGALAGCEDEDDGARDDGPPDAADTGGDPGRDVGGDPGGDTGGDPGDDPGGDPGGDLPADAGGDAAGDAGGDLPGDLAADTAGDTGGDTVTDVVSDTTGDAPIDAEDDPGATDAATDVATNDTGADVGVTDTGLDDIVIPPVDVVLPELPIDADAADAADGVTPDADQDVAADVPPADAEDAVATDALADADTGPAPGTPASTPAARMRATFTALLQEHVYTSGLATWFIVTGRVDPAGAQQAVDRNNEALADAFGDVYGDTVRTLHRAAWNAHTEALQGYARARAADPADDDPTALDAARAAVARTGSALVDAIASLEPGFDRAMLAQAFQAHDREMLGAVDAQNVRQAESLDLLKDAADATFPLAQSIVTTIVAAKADRFPGDPNNDASYLNAKLTAGLQEQAWLAGHATEWILSGNRPDVANAVMERNNTDVNGVIGWAFGEPARQVFQFVWRTYGAALVTNVQALRDQDRALADQAQATLDESAIALADLLEFLSPDMDRERILATLQTHVSALLSAMNGRIIAAADAATRLQDAARMMPDLARTLADAIARQFPGRFTP